jgi:hypothetical protein
MNMKNICTTVWLAGVALCIVSCKGDPGSPGSPSDNIFMAQFQQGVLPSPAFTGMSDTYITSASPNNINAECTDLPLGRNGSDTSRIAFWCDLGLIPPQATVVKAYLTFTTHTASVQGVTAIAYAQPLYWWQGLSGCGVAYSSSYDARWNGPWTTRGGDLSRPMSGEDSVSYISSNRTLSFELDASIVQNWVRNGVSQDSLANYGLIIKSTNEATGSYISVYSSDNTSNIYYRPILTVYYKIPI